MDSLLEQPWRDVISSGFAGAFAAFQIGVIFDHMLPESVLPLRQFFLVAIKSAQNRRYEVLFTGDTYRLFCSV